jgi:hypothetical protein
MSKNSTKSLLIIALFVGTIFASPVMSFANAGTEPVDTSEISADQLGDVVGEIFGMFRQFGASGEALGSVLQLMFTGFTNFSSTMKSYGVFVMNGSIQSETLDETIDYGDGYTWDFEPHGAYQTPGMENAYFHYNETGSATYNRTEGVSVTFIIWDRDMTFIDALDKMLEAINYAMDVSQMGELTEEQQADAINYAVQTVTYFLIHINDIISGDEVIIVNTIAYTTYQAVFNVGGASGTGWYCTEGGIRTNSDGLIEFELDDLQATADLQHDSREVDEN